MMLPLTLILFGAILLDSAITNRSLVDTALARKGEPLSSGGGGAPGTPSQDTPTTAGPGATLKGGNDAPKGLVQFDGHPVAAWIVPGLKWCRKHGYWHGAVTSGWRDPNVVITPSPGLPVAPQGKSNHRGKAWPLGAVDVSDAPGLEEGMKHYPGLLKVKRDPSIGDPVHFSWTGR